LKDVAEDPTLTGRFVQRLLHFSKDIEIFIEDRSNWIGVVTTIWDKIDPKIRLILHTPNLSEQLTDFIQYIEKAKYLVARFACNHVSQRLKAEKAAAYIQQNKKPYSYRPQYNRPQQSDRYNKRYDKQHNERCNRNEQYNERCNRNERCDCDSRNKRFVADEKEKGKERDLKDKLKAYIIDSDNEVSIVSSRLSLSIRSTNTNKIYIVRNALNFHFNHCKLKYSKNFRSIEIKTIYKNNKTYVKTAKLKV